MNHSRTFLIAISIPGYWAVNYRLLKQGKMVRKAKRGAKRKAYELGAQ